jgi:hypothetical protein
VAATSAAPVARDSHDVVVALKGQRSKAGEGKGGRKRGREGVEGRRKEGEGGSEGARERGSEGARERERGLRTHKKQQPKSP